MIEMYLKYDNMHTNKIFNALIFINNHVNSCKNCMLSRMPSVTHVDICARGWVCMCACEHVCGCVWAGDVASCGELDNPDCQSSLKWGVRDTLWFVSKSF